MNQGSDTASDFRNYVASLIFMWSRDVVSSTAEQAYSYSQLAILSQGKAGVGPENTTVFEIRDQDDRFLGRAQQLGDNSRICEITFVRTSNDPVELTLVPVSPDPSDRQDPVTLILDPDLAPACDLQTVRTDDGDLKADSNLELVQQAVASESDLRTALQASDASDVFWYLRSDEAGGSRIKIAPLVKTAHSAEIPGPSDEAEETPLADQVKVFVRPKNRSRFSEEFTARPDGNYVQRRQEDAWHIEVEVADHRIHLSDYPDGIDEIAGAIAKSLLHTGVAHMHVRRWLSGTMPEFSHGPELTSYSQGTANNTTFYSLFSRIHQFADQLDYWIKEEADRAKQGVDWPDSHPIPKKQRPAFSKYVSEFAELANDSLDELNELGLDVWEFITDLFLRGFSSFDIHYALSGNPDFAQDMAQAIVREYLQKQRPNEEDALNSLPFTPDLFDAFALFSPDDKTYATFAEDVPGQYKLLGSLTYVFTGHFLLAHGQMTNAERQRLSPLTELIEHKINQKRHSYWLANKTGDLQTSTAGDPPKKVASAKTSYKGDPFNLFPYERRLLASSLAKALGLHARPGQQLRLFTDPAVQGLSFDQNDIGVVTNFAQAFPDPNILLASKRSAFPPTRTAPAPGVYSDHKSFDFLAKEDSNEVQSRGGELWANSSSSKHGYPFAVIGLESGTIKALSGHETLMADTGFALVKVLVARNCPKREIETHIPSGKKALDELREYLKAPSGPAFGAVLDKLSADVSTARTLANETGEYCKLLLEDAHVFRRLTNTRMWALFRGGNPEEETTGTFIQPPGLGLTGNPFRTSYAGMNTRLYYKLAQAMIHAEKAFEAAGPNGTKTILAPLLENKTTENFDLTAVRSFYGAAQKKTVKSGRVRNDPDIAILEAIWSTALALETPFDADGPNGNNKAFSNLLYEWFSGTSPDPASTDPSAFWTSIVDNL